MAQTLQVIIVGAGLGGLSCAVACRLQGLKVVVLERAPEILPVSIDKPPSKASQLMYQLCL
jgi:salicylate hydroxylase